MEIEEFWERVVKNKKDKFEELKAKDNKKSSVTITLFVLMFPMMFLLGDILGMIMSIFVLPEWLTLIFILVMLAPLSLPFIYIGLSHTKNNHVTYFKNEVLKPFFENCFDNVKYEVEKNFQEKELTNIEKHLFFKSKLNSRDSLIMKINEKEVLVSNVYYNYTYNNRRYEYSFFGNSHNYNTERRDAILIRIPINNYNNSKISIIYNKYQADNYNKVHKIKSIFSKRVNMKYRVFLSQEYQEFNEWYTFYTSKYENKEKMECFIKDFYNLAKKYKANDIGLCIFDNYINVFINQKEPQDFLIRGKELMDYFEGLIDINLTNDRVIECEKNNFNRIYNKTVQIQNLIEQFINYEQFIL